MSNKYERELGVRFLKNPPNHSSTGSNFGKYSYVHSYKNLGLFPKSKMTVQPPEVQETYIDIAGKDGELDLTESLTGFPTYTNREGKFEFTVMNRGTWDYVYSRLMNEIHGRKMYVVLDEDSGWYYTGRLKVSSFKSQKNTATIVVEGEFEPYKIAVGATSERWLWDPFNFETDYARDYSDIVVDGSTEYTILGSRMPVRPQFKASTSGMTVTINGVSYNLSTSYSTPINFPQLRDQEYTMTFGGIGTVSVRFDIGSL